MTNEQQRVRDWMKAFGQDCPETPTIPSLEIRKLRAKLILEEALETIKGLGLSTALHDSADGEMLIHSIEELTPSFESKFEPNLIDIIDGCEDLKVVTEGTLVACGSLTKDEYKKDYGMGGSYCLKYDAHFNEVMRANEGKLWSPEEVCELSEEDTARLTIKEVQEALFLVKDAYGKIQKSPSFTVPDHQKLLNERKSQ